MTGNRRKIKDKSVKDRRRNPPILYWQGNPKRSFLFSRVPVNQRRTSRRFSAPRPNQPGDNLILISPPLTFRINNSNLSTEMEPA